MVPRSGRLLQTPPSPGGVQMLRRAHRWGCVRQGLIAVVLLAGACSNSDDDDAGGDSTVAETTAAPVTTAAVETPADTSAAPDTTAAVEAPADTTVPEVSERDTFVAIEGVPGVSDTEIGFAAFGTNSNNPLGTCVLDCYVDGIEAYFAWRNSEGGIFGRQLVVADSIDDELGKNLERAQDIAASDEYFGAFSATQIASGWATLDDAGIPLWTWSIHPESSGRTHIWGYTGAACYDCTSRGVPWLARESGAKVVATLGYGVSENSKLCARANAASVERYSADIGGTTVGYINEDLAFGLPNGIGPEVTAMKDAGVDFVSACIDLNGMKTLSEEMRRQGMEDVVLIHPNTYNQQFVADADGLFDGDFITVGFVPFEYDSGLEAQAKFVEFMDATGSELTELAMIGWINATQAYEGLLAAGPEFDREKVTAARNAMTADSAGGLIPPIDWTRQHNPPAEDDNTNDYVSECFSAVKIVDGALAPIVDDQTTPWLCWSNESYEWSEPVATSFG